MSMDLPRYEGIIIKKRYSFETRKSREKWEKCLLKTIRILPAQIPDFFLEY